MNTQICVITGQPLANLIPILHFKPQQLIVLVTKDFKNKAKEFRKIVQDINDKQSILMLDGCPDTGLQEIEAFINEKLISHLPAEACDINITGGTKMHSFALHHRLTQRNFEDRFIYIDTRNRLIEYYPTKDKPSFSESLPSVLDAKTTLKGMGKYFIKAESGSDDWEQKVYKYKDFTQWLAENITDTQLQQIIGSINGLVAREYKNGKKDTTLPKRIQLHQHPKNKAIVFLEKACDMQLINWYGGKNISFNNYNQARYLTGQWIEQYVWLIAKSIDFEKIYSGLEFGNMGEPKEKGRAKNEIDLFVQHANASLAIECKSATSTQNADFSQDIFHKLSGVAGRAGGLMCSKLLYQTPKLKYRGKRVQIVQIVQQASLTKVVYFLEKVLVSAFAVSNNNGSLARAKEQGIKIIQPNELTQDLPKILENWKNTGTLRI